MNNLILDNIEKAINAYLKLDSTSKRRLEKLQNRVVTIELLPFHFIFQLCFSADRVEIKEGGEIPAETVVRGTPIQMFSMVMAREGRQKFFAEDIQVEGNVEFGQQVIQLFDEVHIDWEEQLAKLIGDVPSYHLGNFARDVNQWITKTRQSFTKDISEYVHEEVFWLPSKEALHEFYQDIDNLRMDVDRLEARLNHIREQMTERIKE